jgi:hypothetical protein
MAAKREAKESVMKSASGISEMAAKSAIMA